MAEKWFPPSPRETTRGIVPACVGMGWRGVEFAGYVRQHVGFFTFWWLVGEILLRFSPHPPRTLLRAAMSVGDGGGGGRGGTEAWRGGL